MMLLSLNFVLTFASIEENKQPDQDKKEEATS